VNERSGSETNIERRRFGRSVFLDYRASAAARFEVWGVMLDNWSAPYLAEYPDVAGSSMARI